MKADEFKAKFNCDVTRRVNVIAFCGCPVEGTSTLQAIASRLATGCTLTRAKLNAVILEPMHVNAMHMELEEWWNTSGEFICEYSRECFDEGFAKYIEEDCAMAEIDDCQDVEIDGKRLTIITFGVCLE